MKTFKLNEESKIEPGFIVPENYFDTFSSRVMQQIPSKEVKVISIFHFRKNWLYAAAAVLVMALSIPIYQNLITKSSDIDELTLENYITYHTSVSEADMVSLLNEKDIQNINIDLNITNDAIENELSTNKNLEQYLIN